MELEKLFEIDVNNLKIKQYEAVKDSIIETLRDVALKVKEDNWEELLELFAYSPAGDGMGSENHFIDFTHIGKVLMDDLEYRYDLEMIVRWLQNNQP